MAIIRISDSAHIRSSSNYLGEKAGLGSYLRPKPIFVANPLRTLE